MNWVTVTLSNGRRLTFRRTSELTVSVELDGAPQGEMTLSAAWQLAEDLDHLASSTSDETDKESRS